MRLVFLTSLILSCLWISMPSSAQSSSGSTETLQMDIHLVADPTIKNWQGKTSSYALTDEDKEFEIAFSAPMDRKSVEANFRPDEYESETSSRTIVFDWKSDSLLHLTVRGQSEHNQVSFNGARSLDGRVLDEERFKESSMALHYSAQPGQVLRKIDLQGETLAEYHFHTERYLFGSIWEDGKYAVIYRYIPERYVSVKVPRFVDFTAEPFRIIPITESTALYDQKIEGQGMEEYIHLFLGEFGCWGYLPLADALNGDYKITSPLGLVSVGHVYTVGVALAPSGKRIAFLQTKDTKENPADRNPMVLMVWDWKDGTCRIELEMETELHTCSAMVGLADFYSRYRPFWQDEDHVLIQGQTAETSEGGSRVQIHRVSVPEKHAELIAEGGLVSVSGNYFFFYRSDHIEIDEHRGYSIEATHVMDLNTTKEIGTIPGEVSAAYIINKQKIAFEVKNAVRILDTTSTESPKIGDLTTGTLVGAGEKDGEGFVWVY